MLSHRLRNIREKKGLTQQELGRICHLGANQISRYENGTTDPTIQTLKTIANQLGISADFLLGLADEPQGIAAPSEMKPDERQLLDIYRSEGWSGVARLSVEQLSK
ncbi:MAG: helix-turn-helix domain-containing protein [Aggregatilineales bacterium]